MMRPIITMNGDSRRELVNQRIAAMRGIAAAMTAMKEMAPDGRNYIGDPGLLAKDKAIFAERYAILSRLREEIQEEALEIQTPSLTPYARLNQGSEV